MLILFAAKSIDFCLSCDVSIYIITSFYSRKITREISRATTVWRQRTFVTCRLERAGHKVRELEIDSLIDRLID